MISIARSTVIDEETRHSALEFLTLLIEYSPVMIRALPPNILIVPLLHILRVVDAQPQTVEALQQALTPMSEVVARRIDRLMSIVRQCAGAKATDKNM